MAEPTPTPSPGMTGSGSAGRCRLTKGSRIKAMQARHGLTEGEDYDS